MKFFISRILRFLSQCIIKRYHPKVVAITGSVGKTSTKEAVVAVLSAQFRVRGTIKNYNNEIGVPLTVIGSNSPGTSIFGWLGVFLKGVMLCLINDPLYPELLVIEMGADHPGDIGYLTSMVPPDVGVVTAIGEAHYEFFKDLDAITFEKSGVVRCLSEQGIAVLCADDVRVEALKNQTSAHVITYGESIRADVKAGEVRISYDEKDGLRRPVGMRASIHYQGGVVPILLRGVVGDGHIKASLAGIAVGLAMDMHLIDIAQRLEHILFPCGRMRILDGVNGSVLIDDTYNASPLAMVLALDALRACEVGGGRRIAVLGEMLELGDISESAHRDVGERLLAFNVDVLFVVGKQAGIIANEASRCGFSESCIFRFDLSDDAVEVVEQFLRQGDVVLIKGSQGSRMEKVVAGIIADKGDASRLLCRFDKQWL